MSLYKCVLYMGLFAAQLSLLMTMWIMAEWVKGIILRLLLFYFIAVIAGPLLMEG